MRRVLRDVGTAALLVGVPWAVLEVVAFSLRTRLHFGAGDLAPLLVADLALCTAVSVAGAGAAWVILALLGKPSPRRAAILGGLVAATVAFLLSILLTEPIPGRERAVVPGGFVGAVTLSVLPAAALGAVALLRGAPRALVGAWALAGVSALFAWPSGEPAARQGTAPPGSPNVLLITIDTLRADHVAAIGGGPADVRTPHMDRLASEGVLFTRAFSHIPITGPSHTSILSGVRPWTHETLINGIALKAGVPNLPEHLARRGYRTGAFVSAYVLDGDFGYGRGFDTYDDEFYAVKGLYDTTPMRLWYQARIRLWLVDDIERRGDETTDEALSWLSENGRDPFFAWVHLYDPHGVYSPPPPYDTMYHQGDPRDPSKTTMKAAKGLALYFEKFLAGVTDLDWVLAQYKGEVTFTDAQVGRLLGALDELGVRDRTLVWLVADHGESLTEHDYYFNHGAHLYDPDLRVPMMLRYPGKVPAGSRVDGLVDVSDTTPTVLDLLGEPIWPMEGRTLRPLWESGAPGIDGSDAMCFDRDANKGGGMMRFKLVSTRTPDARYLCREQGADELYDVAADPAESRNLVADPSRAGQVADFKARCRRILAATGKGAIDRANQELTADQCEKLKMLGYIDNETDCSATVGGPGASSPTGATPAGG